MGQAAYKQNFSGARARPDKELLGKTHYTGNLVAFKHLQTTVSVPKCKPMYGAAPEKTSKTRGPIDQSPARLPGKTASDFESIQPDHHFLEEVVLSAEGTATPHQRSHVFFNCNLWLAVIGSLSAGTVFGSIWPIVTIDSETRPLAVIGPVILESADVPVREVADPELSALIMRDPLDINKPAGQTTNELPSTEIKSPALDEQQSTEVEKYLKEISQLTVRNTSLHREVEELSNETLTLNQELLTLELQVASLNEQSAPSTEIRTVYNFVNVPIGSATPPAVQASNYAPDNNFSRTPVSDDYVPTVSWDSDNSQFFDEQPNQTFTASATYDSQTGLYNDQQ